MSFFTFCFIPQIVMIIRTKNVSGISLWLWIMVVTAYATGIVYVISLKTDILIVSYSVGFILSLFTTFLLVYYRIKHRIKTN